MGSIRIKICGLTRQEDVEVVNEILPNYAGFIVNYPKSIRSLNPLQVKELCCHLDKKVQAVGVFVNSPIELPIRMLREGTIALAQLHGQEDDAYIRQLIEKTKSPVIKAFSVPRKEDLEMVMRCPASYVLLDHPLGKNGEVVDWSLLRKVGRPFFLAGGLGEENVAEAIKALSPFAVDLNSRLETAGKKDPEKMRRAVWLARQAASEMAGQKSQEKEEMELKKEERSV